MTRLGKLIAVLLLLMWLPATMHCKLETVCGWDVLACSGAADASPSPHQDSDCGDDGCSTVESGGYKVGDNPRFDFTLLPVSLLPVSITCGIQEDLSGTGRSHFYVAPLPPQNVTWQFVFRAALPPRAPSVIC